MRRHPLSSSVCLAHHPLPMSTVSLTSPTSSTRSSASVPAPYDLTTLSSRPHVTSVLRTDSWYVSECFVALGLPTVWIWNRVNVGCYSWNPLTCLLSRFVPLTEG